MRPLAVAIFNDSPTIRAALRAALQTAPDVRVVVEHPNGEDAARVVADSGADVVVMDVVMPGVDGYEATRDIMQHSPRPIVMVSSVVDPRDRSVILAALAAGALHVAEPPPMPGSPDYARRCAAFIELLRTIAGARLDRHSNPAPAHEPTPLPRPGRRHVDAIGIVSSAGGPQALLALLATLPRRALPPILLVQHIAKGFNASFGEWLGNASGYPVEVAEHGVRALPGRLYIAPESHHFWLDAECRLVVDDGPPVGGFRPAGDVLLQHLGATFRGRSLGIVLSGMGQDGAAGAAALRAAGGAIAVQSDPVIDGMPKAAAKASEAARLPIAQLGQWLAERSGVT